MAHYSYKLVRDLLPKHIIDDMGADYEGDGNYDGDQWVATEAYIEQLLVQRTKLVAALVMARDMMISNNLDLPKTQEVISEALEHAKLP